MTPVPTKQQELRFRGSDLRWSARASSSRQGSVLLVMLALLLCGGVWLAALWQRFGA